MGGGDAMRVLLRALLLPGALLTLAACAPAPDTKSEWTQFRRQFIQPDGRLVDPGRQGWSHSEGQGFAMILAVHHDDAVTFANAWNWARTHLQVREDRLLAWSWAPGAGVSDTNNASDGDLIVAWALARAGKRWHEPAYTHAAREIAQAIRTRLLRRDGRGVVLLPGQDGFEKESGTTVNLSYWVFPAFAALAEVDPAPDWDALRDTGLKLLQESRHGRWGLPSDWTLLGETLVPSPDFPPRFGYDAIRIPLYLQWAGLATPQLLDPYRSYWSYFSGARFLPAWTDLTDDSVDSYDAAGGLRAIAAMTLAKDGRHAALPALDTKAGYYPSVLLLLCKAMQAETRR